MIGEDGDIGVVRFLFILSASRLAIVAFIYDSDFPQAATAYES